MKRIERMKLIRHTHCFIIALTYSNSSTSEKLLVQNFDPSYLFVSQSTEILFPAPVFDRCPLP